MELLENALLKSVKFEKNKLILSETLSVDEWKSLGKSLNKVEGSVQFWIGDWARFGERKGFLKKYVNGEVYDLLEEITGLNRQTIADCKWVCEKCSFRNEDLSFGHHRQTASLPVNQQEIFLNRAAQEKLSVKELKLQIMYDCVKGKRDYFHPGPIPIRFGHELQSELQKIAFELNTTIHAIVIDFVRNGIKRHLNKEYTLTISDCTFPLIHKL